MKWKARTNPKIDDIRVVKWFLFFPEEINNEVRWLEISYIKQRYSKWGNWINEKWIDKNEYIYKKQNGANKKYKSKCFTFSNIMNLLLLMLLSFMLVGLFR